MRLTVKKQIAKQCQAFHFDISDTNWKSERQCQRLINLCQSNFQRSLTAELRTSNAGGGEEA